jgi:hypothetical protein
LVGPALRLGTPRQNPPDSAFRRRLTGPWLPLCRRRNWPTAGCLGGHSKDVGCAPTLPALPPAASATSRRAVPTRRLLSSFDAGKPMIFMGWRRVRQVRRVL